MANSHGFYAKALACAVILANFITVSIAAENATVENVSTDPDPVATLISSLVAKKEAEQPVTLPQFIQKMMVRFGETKAAEALQSLDQLPLGLVMKILLVEMDTSLAADIVAMQRYAQSSDKTLITMIGRIVAGDKNVPKELISMDVKLMKFPWWMRIRERMLSNLEKYIAAYSLVPVAVKTAAGSALKPVRVPASPVDGLKSSELASAVAASATESSANVLKQVASAVTVPAAADPPQNIGANLESLKISLLDPIQQQQLINTLALAQAAAATNAQAKDLLLQAQPATNVNPFSLV